MDKISHHIKLFPCQRERGSWQISQGRLRKSLFKDRGVARKPYHLNVGQCDLFSSLILPPLFFHSLSFLGISCGLLPANSWLQRRHSDLFKPGSLSSCLLSRSLSFFSIHPLPDTWEFGGCRRTCNAVTGELAAKQSNLKVQPWNHQTNFLNHWGFLQRPQTSSILSVPVRCVPCSHTIVKTAIIE